jgi:hypothetical protein
MERMIASGIRWPCSAIVLSRSRPRVSGPGLAMVVSAAASRAIAGMSSVVNSTSSKASTRPRTGRSKSRLTDHLGAARSSR